MNAPQLLPLSKWRDRASVRQGQAPRESEAPDGDWLSRGLVPMTQHPDVRDDHELVQHLLGQQLVRFLVFTEHLENDLVVPVARDLADERMGLVLDAQALDHAGLVGLDEVHHANRSRSLRRQVSAYLGTTAPSVVKSVFLDAVLQAYAQGTAQARLQALGAVLVTETLITGALRKTAQDPRVDSHTGAVFGEHHHDEAAHHGFFAWLMREAWPQLNAAAQDFLGGEVIPGWISSYLQPDIESWLGDMQRLGFSPAQAERIVAESHDAAAQQAAINAAALPTLTHMRRAGMLDHAAVRAGLARNGLLVKG